MDILNIDDSQKINILGVRVDDLSKENVIGFILASLESKKKIVLSYVNVHTINLAYRTPWFRAFLNASDVVFCDGVGVKLAARILYQRRLERFTPPDWFPLLVERCSRQGRRFYFIGSRPGVVEKAAHRLADQIPNFRPAGMDHGYHAKQYDSQENRTVVDAINRSGADILVVGFGMPMQEQWIKENLDDLNVNVVLPVGAAFDYLAGEIYRAPRWMTDRGWEWLGRLLVEPGRLWKRYLLGNPQFFWRVLLQKLGIIEPKDVR